MSLIKCSECSNEVSDKAMVCPRCGNPINDLSNQTLNNPDKFLKVELELTNKKWKRVILISWIAIFLSPLVGIILAGRNDPAPIIWMLVFLSVCGLIIGKIGAWYSNK